MEKNWGDTPSATLKFIINHLIDGLVSKIFPFDVHFTHTWSKWTPLCTEISGSKEFHHSITAGY